MMIVDPIGFFWLRNAECKHIFENLDAITIFMYRRLFTFYVFGTVVAYLKARLLCTLGKLFSSSDLWKGNISRATYFLSISGFPLNAEGEFRY